MKAKQLAVATILSLAACTAVAQSGLEIFNAKRSQVQNNQAVRATEQTSANNNVLGSGSNWDEIVENELQSYVFNASGVASGLRSEFQASDTTVDKTITKTESDISKYNSTTSRDISNLSKSASTKVSSLSSTTNSALSTATKNVNTVKSSMDTSKAKINTLLTRIAQLESDFAARLACN